MFLKILPDLDMPLTSLHTKNYYPRFKGLGDIEKAFKSANPNFFWDILYETKPKMNTLMNTKPVSKTQLTLPNKEKKEKSTTRERSKKIFLFFIFSTIYH